MKYIHKDERVIAVPIYLIKSLGLDPIDTLVIGLINARNLDTIGDGEVQYIADGLATTPEEIEKSLKNLVSYKLLVEDNNDNN